MDSELCIKPYQYVDIKKFYDDLSRYINALSIDENTKQVILNKEFIEKNPSIYLYYPYLYNEAFNVIGNIKKLSIAGFLYYRSIIYLDDLLDNKKSGVKSIIHISICQEESIKILSSLFPLESSFWSIWNKRRCEYLQAYKMDKAMQNSSSFRNFEKLADYKSAFGKVAIDGLYCMSKNKNIVSYNKILESHKYFYVGFQIMDDIEDITEDIKNGQTNIAVQYLTKEIKARGIDVNTQSDESIVKYIYIFGVAEKLLDKCILSLNKSEQVICDQPLNNWQSEIRKLRNMAIVKQLNIKAYIQNLLVTSKLSVKNRKGSSSIKKIIYQGLDFLNAFQNEQGAWKEYYNEAGMSDSWATAFILSYLCQNPLSNNKLEVAKKKGISFLKNSKNGELWGYNKEWIPDADSTSFVLLTRYKYYKKDITIPLINKWFEYQNEDGGFATYKNSNDILWSLNSNEQNISVKGWTTSHICVSAVAFYYLSLTDQKNTNYFNLENFLINSVNNDGLWDSYWWTSPIYSTSFLMKSANLIKNKKLANIIDHATEQIVKLQNTNGSFGDKYVTHSPFYTGLVVDAICEIPKYFNMFKSQIDNAVDWLKNSQMDDGSWVATSAMRMPDSKIIDPSIILEWPEDTKGLNIRAKEFNRLFSTTVSVSALAKYEQISSERI